MKEIVNFRYILHNTYIYLIIQLWFYFGDISVVFGGAISFVFWQDALHAKKIFLES